MSTPIVWLHGDSLSPQDTALQNNPDAPAVFVFDEQFLGAAKLSFKRLFFLYECALEAIAGREGQIRRGAVVAEVVAFCNEHGGDEIHVTASVSPRFHAYLDELRNQITVVVHEPDVLVAWQGEAPRRFSKFWRKVDREAMQPTGDGPPELEAPKGDV